MANVLNICDQPTQGALQAHQFNVQSYGALGDNLTDDTPAARAAYAAAWSYAQNNQGYAEVLLPPARYLFSSPAVKSTANKGNAQLWTPLVAGTARKASVEIKGVDLATSLPHWQQTTPQLNGAVIRSTIMGTNDGTWGEASVIGCPTPAQGYGYTGFPDNFNNVHVGLQGIQIQTQPDGLCAVDLRSAAEVTIRSCSLFTDTSPPSIGLPSATWIFGLAMPMTDNNDISEIDDLSIEGYTYGILTNEHCHIRSARIIYGQIAIAHCSQATSHWAQMDYLSVEACQTALTVISAGGGVAKLNVSLLDWETGSSPFTTYRVINNASNLLGGRVCIAGISNTLLNSAQGVVGPSATDTGHNLEVFNLEQTTGVQTPPAVPASGTPFVNPFWKNCMVFITGGTVSGISVDGTATGLVATGAGVVVPTGRSITLTYTLTPSWDWVAF